VRASRPNGRPIVLPEALPRLDALGSRTLLLPFSPIVRPIRDVDFDSVERKLFADFFFAADIEGSLLPITPPIPRPL